MHQAGNKGEQAIIRSCIGTFLPFSVALEHCGSGLNEENIVINVHTEHMHGMHACSAILLV